MDETGAKVRGKDTQRPCQGSHPVDATPQPPPLVVLGSFLVWGESFLPQALFPTPSRALEIPFLSVMGFCLCYLKPSVFLSTS